MKKTLLSVAIEAAHLSGKLLMASYGKLKKSQVSMKTKNDFVTEIDKKSEKTIIATVKKYFPDHQIHWMQFLILSFPEFLSEQFQSSQL